MAAISVAGPLAEIVSGIIVLVALGANPLSWDSVRATDTRWTVFFLGPMLGIFNLVPILPLDGGSIASLALDRFFPGRGRYWYQVASLVVCAAGVFWVLTSGSQYRFLLFTFGMLGVMNFMGLQQARMAQFRPRSSNRRVRRQPSSNVRSGGRPRKWSPPATAIKPNV